MRCTIWRDAAEHVAESLTRGDRVVVQGRLRQRSFETRDGDKCTVVELEVDEIGPSLRYATAKVTKASRTRAESSCRGTDAHTTHHRHPHLPNRAGAALRLQGPTQGRLTRWAATDTQSGQHLRAALAAHCPSATYERAPASTAHSATARIVVIWWRTPRRARGSGTLDSALNTSLPHT
jgi:single-stranded DNA-binding protein